MKKVCLAQPQCLAQSHPVPPPTHAYSCHDTISRLALTRAAKARALLWDLHHCELNESLPFTYHSALSILL